MILLNCLVSVSNDRMYVCTHAHIMILVHVKVIEKYIFTACRYYILYTCFRYVSACLYYSTAWDHDQMLAVCISIR